MVNAQLACIIISKRSKHLNTMHLRRMLMKIIDGLEKRLPCRLVYAERSIVFAFSSLAAFFFILAHSMYCSKRAARMLTCIFVSSDSPSSMLGVSELVNESRRQGYLLACLQNFVFPISILCARPIRPKPDANSMETIPCSESCSLVLTLFITESFPRGHKFP